MHLVGFIIRIYHDARSSESQILISVPYILTMGNRGSTLVKVLRYKSEGR